MHEPLAPAAIGFLGACDDQWDFSFDHRIGIDIGELDIGNVVALPPRITIHPLFHRCDRAIVREAMDFNAPSFLCRREIVIEIRDRRHPFHMEAFDVIEPSLGKVHNHARIFAVRICNEHFRRN